MNIIQLPRRFSQDDWGGTETVILETSKQLLRMGHRTEVLCTEATASRRSDVVEGIQVTRTPYFYPYLGLSGESKRLLDKKGGSPFSFSLMRRLERYPALDLIHLHCGGRIGGIGRYVARKRRIPYLVSLHGAVFDVPEEEEKALAAPMRGALDLGKALGWWVGSRRVLEDAAAILCVGYADSVAGQRAMPHKKIIYLPNGVDAARFARGNGPAFRTRQGIPPRARVMLTAARIDTQKNQLYLVRMLPRLLQEAPDLHLLLIGHVANEAYFDRISRLIDEQQLRDHVTIIRGLSAGAQDLVDAYHACDVFCLPSIHEPFGIVILEAWAAGRPVMASRVGGIPTFVADGHDGLLFDLHDDETFLRAFRTFTQDPERMRAMAEAGREKAFGEYGWDRVTQRLVGIYEEAIRENPLRQ